MQPAAGNSVQGSFGRRDYSWAYGGLVHRLASAPTEDQVSVDRSSRKGFDEPVRPTHEDPVHRCGVAQTEMHARIVARGVAERGLDQTPPTPPTRQRLHLGA